MKAENRRPAWRWDPCHATRDNCVLASESSCFHLWTALPAREFWQGARNLCFGGSHGLVVDSPLAVWSLFQVRKTVINRPLWWLRENQPVLRGGWLTCMCVFLCQPVVCGQHCPARDLTAAFPGTRRLSPGSRWIWETHFVVAFLKKLFFSPL